MEIVRDADIVMFLSREIENDRTAPVLLNIAKHRNGALDTIRLDWNGACMRFTESDNQSKYPIKPKSDQETQYDTQY